MNKCEQDTCCISPCYRVTVLSCHHVTYHRVTCHRVIVSQTGKLRELVDMLGEEEAGIRPVVMKLVTVSLAEVFKDIIPDYRIRLQTEIEEQQQVRLFVCFYFFKIVRTILSGFRLNYARVLVM